MTNLSCTDLVPPIEVAVEPPEHATRTLAVLQPSYLSWLGFFDQMYRADSFVLYDDVQYDKNGWRNRNRIKNTAGEPHWLTVPVRLQHLGQLINEVEIDNKQNWARKHVDTIKQFYKKAPYLKVYLPALEELLNRRWERLIDLNAAVIQLMQSWLGVDTPGFRSSELGIGGDRNQRLLNLCLHFNANTYLSGNAAKCYLDTDLFTSNGIEIRWQDYSHPVYTQLHGDFVPYLSSLDLLLNCGDASYEILTVRNGVIA